jgi:hypothetical protein
LGEQAIGHFPANMQNVPAGMKMELRAFFL